MLEQKKKLIKFKTKEQKERRSFLKKAVYAAPKLIVLGTLMRPNNANANLGLPPSLNEQPASFGEN